MSVSPMVAEWVAAYEREHGRMPAEASVNIAEYIEKTGSMLQMWGAEDARNGTEPSRSETFSALVRQIFRLGEGKYPEAVQAVAELWETDYLEGYRKGGKADA